MNFGLDDNTINQINTVFAKFLEIDEVVIYGSRAKGSYREGSDIDLTMKGSKVNQETQSRVNSLLNELSTPYLFDLSIFSELESTDFIEHIESVGKIFYKKN